MNTAELLDRIIELELDFEEQREKLVSLQREIAALTKMLDRLSREMQRSLVRTGEAHANKKSR